MIPSRRAGGRDVLFSMALSNYLKKLVTAFCDSYINAAHESLYNFVLFFPYLNAPHKTRMQWSPPQIVFTSLKSWFSGLRKYRGLTSMVCAVWSTGVLPSP